MQCHLNRSRGIHIETCSHLHRLPRRIRSQPKAHRMHLRRPLPTRKVRTYARVPRLPGRHLPKRRGSAQHHRLHFLPHGKTLQQNQRHVHRHVHQMPRWHARVCSRRRWFHLTRLGVRAVHTRVVQSRRHINLLVMPHRTLRQHQRAGQCRLHRNLSLGLELPSWDVHPGALRRGHLFRHRRHN